MPETMNLTPNFAALRARGKHEAEIFGPLLAENITLSSVHSWMWGVTTWLNSCENGQQVEEVQKHMSDTLSEVTKLLTSRQNSDSVIRELLVEIQPVAGVTITDVTENFGICTDASTGFATQAFENTITEWTEQAEANR